MYKSANILIIMNNLIYTLKNEDEELFLQKNLEIVISLTLIKI